MEGSMDSPNQKGGQNQRKSEIFTNLFCLFVTHYKIFHVDIVEFLISVCPSNSLPFH